MLNKKKIINYFKKNKYVLIYFWGDWCNSCKILYYTLKIIKKKFKNRIIIKKINVDKNKSIINKYNIQSIPTLIIFNYNKIIFRNVGIIEKYDLIKKIKFILKKYK